MKQLFYALLILGLIYFVYWYLTKPPDIIEVYGTVRILEENSDVDSGGQYYKASVQGTAKNTGTFTAKDIWITYKIEDTEVNTYISELKPNQTVNFRTGSCRTKNKDPEIELVDVIYNK